MRINFTSRHYKAPEKLKEYAEAKVQRLKKYYDGIIECTIILDYEKARHSTQVAEITIKVLNQRLVATEKSDDVYRCIDNAVMKLERQVKKYKGKLRDHKQDRSEDNELTLGQL